MACRWANEHVMARPPPAPCRRWLGGSGPPAVVAGVRRIAGSRPGCPSREPATRPPTGVRPRRAAARRGGAPALTCWTAAWPIGSQGQGPVAPRRRAGSDHGPAPSAPVRVLTFLAWPMPITIVGQKESTRAAALRRGPLVPLGGTCGLLSMELPLYLSAAAHATCITTPEPRTWFGRLVGCIVRDARRTHLDQVLSELLYKDSVAAVPSEFRFTLRTRDGRVVRLALVPSLTPTVIGIIALESELA